MADSMGIGRIPIQTTAPVTSVSTSKAKAAPRQNTPVEAVSRIDTVEISAQAREAMAKAAAQKAAPAAQTVPAEAMNAAQTDGAPAAQKTAPTGASAAQTAAPEGAPAIETAQAAAPDDTQVVKAPTPDDTQTVKKSSSSAVLTSLSEAQLDALVKDGAITRQQADQELSSRVSADSSEPAATQNKARETTKNSYQQSIQAYVNLQNSTAGAPMQAAVLNSAA